MSRITIKEKVVNDGEVETRFAGKNLTSSGGIRLFHKFAQKLGVEEALGQSINLPRREGKYKTEREMISLLYALVLELNRPSDTVHLQPPSQVVHRALSSENRGGECKSAG